ncbi:MAG: hypothetical protein R3F59_01095 [Myxococcota bacterium]
MMLHLIHRMGLDRRNLRSLPLLPLVEVAWADGRIQPGESRVILEAADDRQLNDDDRLMLEDWMRHSPSPAYLRSGRVALAWLRRHGDPSIDPQTLEHLVDDAQRVAEAAGGLFGFRRVCRAERETLERLEQDLAADDLPPMVRDEPHPDFVTPNNRCTLAVVNSITAEGDATLEPMFDTPMRLPVRPRGLTMGSSDTADVRIVDDPQIAVDHAAIYAKATGYVVRALEGPVWINGERHTERRLLGGETLRLSDGVSFVFKWVRPLR